jgi:hypothetical protein
MVMMGGESNSGSKYFTKNFQSSDVSFNKLKEKLYRSLASFSANSEREIARQIKEYCQENEIKLKTNKQDSSNRSTYATRSSSASGNVNITINENKGLSFWDYLLLQNLFSNKQQPIIINNDRTAAYSAPTQEKKEKSEEGRANVLIFLAALCVLTHLAVCAVYHMYFKKEAEKSEKSIDYLTNRQLGIAAFQLAFGLASLVTGGVFLNQSEIFFPLLINTFICLGSACLFYRERNNTLKTEVEPYMKLAKLLIEDEYKENLQRNRRYEEQTSSSQNFGDPSTTHDGLPPPYSPQASAPAYDNQGGYGIYLNPSSQVSYADVTKQRFSVPGKG